MRKRIVSLFIASSMALTAASGITIPTVSAESAGTVVRLDPSEASPFNNGEFQGWGTSLCWWANRLGYSESLTEQAADAFFSETGLGLDIARYNLGGGDDPTHNHITRSDSKVPGYATGFDDNGDIVYDWTVDENQRNIALAALEANPDLYVEGFSNSPPWFMTNSGCSSGAQNAGDDNLSSEHFDDFGKFIAEATKHFKEEFGITFKSYSPMNEPDTTYWGANSPKQEGAHYSPGDTQSGTIISTRKALDDAGLTDVLVAGMDETDIGKTITNYGKLSAEAKTALGRIDTHTYSGSDRAGVKATAVSAGKDLWMSEVDGGWDGFGLASRIITDMNGMQPAAWVMWDIVDSHKDSSFQTPDGTYSEKNASLNVTGSLWGVGMADHDTETLQLANKYYFFGQFTKYINPGDTIIASSNNTLAAYNKKNGDIKIVALNSSSADQKYTFDLAAFTSIGDTVREIRTNNATGSSAEHWKEIYDEATLSNKKLASTLKAGTVTTYIITSSPYIESCSLTSEKASYKYDLNDTYTDCDTYFAIYGADGALKSLTMNEDSKEIRGDFTNCTYKLLVWKDMKPLFAADAVTEAPGVTNPGYAIIKGGGNQISVGSTVNLTVATNIDGDVTWSSSDETVASVTENGEVTALKSGSVTIYAKVGDFTTSRDFEIPMYKLTGSASWGNDSNRPADSADYAKAADGDLSTYFDGTTGGYVQYDYGQPFKVSQILLAARDGEGMSARTVGGAVQGSNDAISWTELYKIASAIPAGEYTAVNASALASDKAYRYYRYINTQNMANIAEFLIEGDASDDTPENDPVITDLNEFTDNFENSSNIFGASYGSITDGGSVVFNSALDRFGNVFAPVRTTATSELSESIELKSNQKFRLSFTMFSGWESSGKENTFAIKDADGNEIAALYITGGGYNFNQIRIGGKNVLTASTIAQSRSNPGTSKAGANGWNASGQPYVNTVGYNKTVEIIIDGNGAVTISATGGMEDTVVSGMLSSPVTIGSIETTGDYNAAAERTVSYDNFDGDIITYSDALATPLPATPTPEPTDPPTLPASGELINLNFDNSDLTSSSSYGAAAAMGTAKFAEVDGRKCLQLDGTNATVIKLTDANGNSLLTGQKNITVSFKVKPTVTATSWWLYAAPNDNAQTYQSEKYFGAHTNSGNINIERYNNSGSRSAMTTGECAANEWSDVIISVNDDVTSVYINGTLAGSAASSVNISEMLGNNSVAYIGRANWNSGEFATGYIDDFVIYNYALDSVLAGLDLGDLSEVTENITLPQTLEGSNITWTTSDADVVTAAGVVARADETKAATLTASTEVKGVTLTKTFDVTVKGYTAVLDTFTAYAENGTIKFTSDWTSDEAYNMSVTYAKTDSELISLNQIDNTASGIFADCANGTYKVRCTLKDKSAGTAVKSVVKTVTVKTEEAMGAYLFVHFVGTESSASQEQIYFSVSSDGSTWKTLKNGSPVLTSDVGEKGVRDPYILRGEDGKFFIIATDLSIYNRLGDSNRWSTCQTSGSKNIVVWESSDLVNWSSANLVKVALDTAGCTWAPEAVYDAEKDQYMVFWASKVSTDNYAQQRIYRSYTSDFKTFSEPEVYIDNGYSTIDTTITSYKGVYYRFTKDEAKSSITMMKSASLSSGWKDVDSYTLNGAAGNSVTGYEGPTIYKLNGEDKWCLLLDYYSKSQGYKPFVTSDITKGTFTSASDFNFDTKYRHGTVIPITSAEYQKLLSEYGE